METEQEKLSSESAHPQKLETILLPAFQQLSQKILMVPTINNATSKSVLTVSLRRRIIEEATLLLSVFFCCGSVALPAFSSCLLFSPRWECSFRDASGSSPAAGGTGLDHHRCTGQDKTHRERKTQIAVHPGALFQVHLHSCQFCQSRELSY